MKANEIKQLRIQLGWNQKDLVNASGVSQSDISKIESNSILPPPDILKKIEKALTEKLKEQSKLTVVKFETVSRPETDEEVIIFRHYIQFADLKDGDEKYELFKKLYLAMGKFIDRKENYLSHLKQG